MWLLLLILAITALVYFIHRQYTYWDRVNLPHEPVHIPFGSLDPVRRHERSFGMAIYDIYVRSKEKLVGVYLLYRPTILIRDAELVRQIMTTDFGSFHDRGVNIDHEKDLFSLRGQAWRTLRAKLTPSFSSGKLKGMFGTVNDVADKMVAHLNGELKGKSNELLEMKAVMTTYAVDIVGSVIFGLDIDSFAHPDNEFRIQSSKLFEPRGILETINGLSTFICPSLVKVLEFIGYEDPIFPTLKNIVKRTIEFREKNNVVRKDMLQLLIQLRNTGQISEDDKNWGIGKPSDQLQAISTELIAAQVFLFYIAGSETTAATASFTLYELAMNPDVLRRAKSEVEECLQKYGHKPTDHMSYEAVQDMKFLELCLMETTRKYPALPFLNRECTQDWLVPDTNFTIKKGTPILISLLGMHRDPEYFPEPMKYDPERFTEENSNYNHAAYMPFGVGPRHCIAQRMGKLNAKLAVAKVLANFNIESLPYKELEFIYNPAPVLIPKGGLKLRLSPRVF